MKNFKQSTSDELLKKFFDQPMGEEPYIQRAKKLYNDYVNSQPIHSNRFPSWEELSEDQKFQYFEKLQESDKHEKD